MKRETAISVKIILNCLNLHTLWKLEVVRKQISQRKTIELRNLTHIVKTLDWRVELTVSCLLVPLKCHAFDLFAC